MLCTNDKDGTQKIYYRTDYENVKIKKKNQQ